jgi:predicted nucleic acid-binding protein
MISILDASAAVEIALGKDEAPVFNRMLIKSEIVLAPDLFVSEITNVFWKYRKFTGISDSQCIEGIEFCINLIDDYVETKELFREVFSQSVSVNHSVYDVFYLVIARRHSARLLTCDRKLKNLAERLNIPTN